LSILQGELAEDVAAALDAADVPYALTVTRQEQGEPDPETPWEPGPIVDVPYDGRGWVENYDDDAIDETVIDARDVRVMILTTSISIEPTDTDTLTLDGKAFTIVNVKRDASGALFIIQARA
jgi:hypothetical protein